MKTQKQIRKWLQTQEWYPQFKKNMRKEPEDKQKYILIGKAYSETIKGAFIWNGTPEGINFWWNVNIQFLKWYEKEEKEMTKEQLEKANSLKDEIDSIESFLRVHENNVRMEIGSYPSSNKGEGLTVWIDRKHQYEIIDLLKKWKDEYEKELEEI